MATPTPRSPFAVQPKAPLRGQGPARPDAEKPAEKPDFVALAKERTAPLGAAPAPDKQRVSTPMSLPAANPQGRGYTPPSVPVSPPQKHGYANPSLNDASIREAALAQLAEKQKAGTLAGMADKTRGMVPGRGDGGMVSEYPSAAISNPTETNPNPTAEDAAGMKASVDALHDQSTPIFGKAWDDKTGTWLDQSSENELPPGVGEDTPGVYYDPEMNEWVYDPEGGADMDAIDAQVEKALGSKAEDYGMSDELMAQNNADLDRQGADAKSKLSQQLAGRGLGASGLAGAGFGNIDVGTQSAKTALATDNFKIGVEARQNELKTLLTAHGNELSEKNRREIADQIAEADKQKLDYEKLSQKEADQFTFLHDSLANLGASSWSPEAWAAAMKMIKSGTSYEDAMAKLAVKTVNGTKVVGLAAKSSNDGASGTAPPAGIEQKDWDYYTDNGWAPTLGALIDNGHDPFSKEIPDWYTQPGQFDPATGKQGDAKHAGWSSLTPQQQAKAWTQYMSDDGTYEDHDPKYDAPAEG